MSPAPPQHSRPESADDRKKGVTACLLVHGDPSYAEVARVAVDSLLADSDFEVFVAHAPGPVDEWRLHPRLRRQLLPPETRPVPRAHRFLKKFQALSCCLQQTSSARILLLDADVVLARPLRERELQAALGKADLGMVEQKSITGSAMNRASFRDHYTRHTLALLDPAGSPPALSAFRYYNSGVVLGTRALWERLVPWAIQTMNRIAGDHHVGDHMIADQDYLQYWSNNLHPGGCVELPWYWNHCEYWDDHFPRRGVLFAHFSNFCNGPARNTAARMKALRRTWPRLMNRCIPPSSL